MFSRGVFMVLKQRIITFNNRTGEVINEKIKDLYYNPFDPKKGYNFKYKSRTIKSYLDIELPKCFSDSEVGKIFRLSRCIYGDSNLLARRVHSTVKPLTKEYIIKEFKLKDRQGRALLKKLIDNKVLKPVPISFNNRKEIHYYFNPIYFFSGTYLSLNLYLIFQDELKNHLPEHVILKFLEQAERLNIKTEEKTG
jgi:hypothetical protein